MIKPRKPSNESERLEALQRYQILDTMSEQAYNDITRIASAICETQIAVISLVDKDRQWFKSILGLDAKETSRDIAFCAHAILKDELLEVPDATLDERFKENPLVIGDPHIKFYAGAPLVTSDGLALGTLCVIDSKPKKLSPQQSEILASLARQVMNLLELRLNIKSLGQLAQDLAKAKEQSLHLAQVKSEFLANMSHEIRTPMNGIMGMTEILLQKNLTPEQQECAGYIESSAKHLMTLLNDILDFSKIEAGKLNIEKTDFNLSNLLGDIEKTFSFQANQKGLNLKIDSPRLLFPLQGDVTRLKQILINFVSNAIKFTEKGFVQIQVQRLKGQRFRFEVQDSGIGIPKESMHLLFQEFSQVDSSTTRKYGGSGLGLSICKRLVEMMGGEMGALSEIGKGSCFWFELDLEENKEAKRVEPKISKKIEACRYRVLVAEDNLVNQLVVSKLLTLMGHECFVVPNGQEAVKAVQTDNYDLVLMDCQMEVMDGFEATRIIRALKDPAKNQIPIVALTATTRKEDFEKCLQCGMNDHMGKPFTRDQLEQKIQAQQLRKAS